MWDEFKKFAIKGNVIDLAVGVIIGGAFGKIVSSLVADVLMPLISILTGGKHDIANLAIKVGSAELKYGAFLQNIIDFFIISFSIFLFVKLITRFTKKEEAAPVVEKIDRKEELLAEIRDLLREDKDILRKNETS